MNKSMVLCENLDDAEFESTMKCGGCIDSLPCTIPCVHNAFCNSFGCSK